VILCLAFGPSVDLTFVVDQVHLGEAHRSDNVRELAGGKGINVARAIHTLGGQSVAAGVVGGHAGHWLAETLRSEGVTTALIDGSVETRTCVSVVATDTHRITEFYPAPTVVLREEWALLEARAIELIGETSNGWLAMSGSFPATLPVEVISRLTTAAHRRRWKVAVDTSGPPLIAALDAEVDLIKVNRAEAATMFGEVDVPALVTRLSSKGSTAIVTNGVDGAYASEVHITSNAVGRYSVGSGDCFLAGYLTAMEQGAGREHALRLAIGAASANAEQPGAAVFDPARAKALAATATFGRW
jgi:1-phosphofructokinase/tagatose 6-phosphate kinase